MDMCVPKIRHPPPQIQQVDTLETNFVFTLIFSNSIFLDVYEMNSQIKSMTRPKFLNIELISLKHLLSLTY